MGLALMAAIGLVGLGGLGFGAGCKKKSAAKKAPPVAIKTGPTGPTTRAIPRPPGPPPATAPDTTYEARRKLLLQRGDPNMMKDAPVAETKAPEIDPGKLIKPVGKDLLLIGGHLKVDLGKGRIEIPAQVASPGAPLEYVAVSPNGKAYESLLIVDTNAIELRLALSLLGYEGVIPSDKGQIPPADADNSVLVSAIVGGKERPIAAYLIDRATKKPPPEHPWEVVSFRPDDKDQSLLTRDFFTLVQRDYFAPLQYSIEAGNPYAGPNQGYSGNEKLLPPAKGELTLVIKRRPDKPAAPSADEQMMDPMLHPPGAPAP